MTEIFERDTKCQACNGTGVYVGLAERNGAGIQCLRCKGSGCYKLRIEWEPFTGKIKTYNIKRVYRANPGIVIGTGNAHNLEDFGGIPYDDWWGKPEFPLGTEDRAHTCPAWFYQAADYKLKPNWEECFNALGKTFSACPHFKCKEKCWKRFDEEQSQ